MVHYYPVAESCSHVARGLESGGLIALRRSAPVGKQNIVWATWPVSKVTGTLFFVCKVNIMSHFNNKSPCKPYQIVNMTLVIFKM